MPQDFNAPSFEAPTIRRALADTPGDEHEHAHGRRARLRTCLRALLPSLPATQLDAVLAQTRVVELAAGAALEPPSDGVVTASIVLQGRLEVPSPEGALHLGPGAALHLRALLAPPRWPVRRVEHVVARRRSWLAQLPRAALVALSRSLPALASDLVTACDAEVTTGVRPAASDALDCMTIAVIAVSGASTAPKAAPIAQALAQELSRWGAVAGEPLAAAAPRVPQAGVSWARNVMRHELTARFVVAAPSAAADVEAALAQADRVVLCAGPDPSALGDRDRALLWRSVRRAPGTVHLALVHGPDSTPDARNLVWARHALVDLTHNLRGDREGYARLARFLTGRASALVLTGKGARAWAGLGVLEELERRGRSPDLVCGVGDGASIAHLYAHTPSARYALRTLTRTARRLLDLLRRPTPAQVRERLDDGLLAELGVLGDLTGWRPCITLAFGPAGVGTPTDLPSLLTRISAWCPQELVWLVKTRKGSPSEGIGKGVGTGVGTGTYLARAGAGHRTVDIRLSRSALRNVRAIAAASRAARDQAARGLTQELPKVEARLRERGRALLGKD